MGLRNVKCVREEDQSICARAKSIQVVVCARASHRERSWTKQKAEKKGDLWSLTGARVRRSSIVLEMCIYIYMSRM